MKKEWFESWFESDLYDIMYKHRDMEEASSFLSKLLMQLSPDPNANFLDLACGTGRHARFIHDQGYQVTGIDLSNRKIAIASKSSSDNLEFYIQDMRKPFRINYFDFVLNLFTSFGYFENIRDNLRVIKSVKSSLKPGGVFVIDYLNGILIEKNLVPQEEKIYDDWKVNITKQVVNKRLTKRMDWSNGEIERSYAEKVTLFTLEDFREMLGSQGFIIDEVYGDYNLTPYEKESSSRLIMVCSC